MNSLSSPPQLPSKDERQWAMFAHLSTFLGLMGIPFANIVAPLIIWQVKKDEMPFVSEQAKEVLNFQILMTILSIVCIPLVFLLIGIPLLLALIVFDVCVTIIGAMKANDGISYRYPLNLRLIK